MFKNLFITLTITGIILLTNMNIPITNHLTNIKVSPIIGRLIIDKININNSLYNINNQHNNIEENITILKGSTPPTINESIMIIAAHSGTGKIAYFNNLDQLQLKDQIILIYKKKKYQYQITKIWEENKNGYIHIKKDANKKLVLTTCSKKYNKQLIVESILKRVN